MTISSLIELWLIVVRWDCSDHFILDRYGSKLVLIKSVVKHACDDPQTTLKTTDETPVRKCRRGVLEVYGKLLLNFLSLCLKLLGQQHVSIRSRVLKSFHMSAV